MKKRVTIGGVIVICLVMLALFGAVLKFTNNFTEVDFSRPLNENNQYTAECMTIKDSNDGNGIVISVNENGSFKVKGTATEDITKEIGKVKLAPGTYTATAIDGGAKNTVYVTYEFDGVTGHADFTDRTFTVEVETEVTLTLHIEKDSVINCTVYPVIVEGEANGSFFG